MEPIKRGVFIKEFQPEQIEEIPSGIKKPSTLGVERG